MNLQEFSKLRAGDKIQNTFSQSEGTVTEATESGVRVKWSESSPPFFYSVQSTTWMHWTKAES